MKHSQLPLKLGLRKHNLTQLTQHKLHVGVIKKILLSVCYISHVTSSLTNILFYFTNVFLHLSIDYCFISHILKLRLSTFFSK